MISTRDLKLWVGGVAAPALLLAGCSDAAPELPPMERVESALEAGDGFGAELILRDLLAAGTPREELAAFMGEAELLQGQPVEARRWLGEGRFSESTAGRGFHQLGRLEIREGNLPSAGQAFDRAFAHIPEDPDLWVDIGRLRYRGGEQSQAVDAAIRAIELGPEHPDALLFRGQLIRDSEGVAAALPWFEKALSHKPNQLDLLAEYAATLGEAGEVQEMLSVVRHMANLNPGYLRSYYLQAVVAARAGQYDLARKLLFRSGDFVADAPAGIMLSGVIDLETGNYASASQQFDRLLRQQPENSRVRSLLARSLAMGGNHRELVHRFGDSATLSSASPYLKTLVARAYEALGDRAEAANLLDQAQERQTGNLVAVQPSGVFDSRTLQSAESGQQALDLVRSYITAGRGADAISIAEDFKGRFSGSADALGLAGDAQLAARKVGLALDRYQRSARIRQYWPLARKRVVALSASGNASEAKSLLERYLIGHPKSVEPAFILARMQYDKGNLPRAAQLLDHALIAGADRDPEVLALRAIVALRMDQPDIARRIAARAHEVSPLHPASLQAMAMMSDEAVANVLLAKNDSFGGSARIARR